MGYRDRYNLFSEFDLAEYLNAQLAGVQELVDRIPKHQFQSTTDEDLIEFVIFYNKVDPIVIHEDRITVSRDGESEAAVSRKLRRFAMGSDRQFPLPEHEMELMIPFSGDSNLFRVKTNLWDSSLPKGKIIQRENGIGLIIIKFQQARDVDSDDPKLYYDRNIHLLKQHMSQWEVQIEKFNQSLSITAEKTVLYRRRKLDKQNTIEDMFSVPANQKIGAPTFDPDKARKKDGESMPP